MKKLKVAVIGCGSISVMHLESILKIDEAVLAAVCDINVDKARATAEKYGTKYYTDYNEMLAAEALDAVHICLPHYLHTEAAKAAFNAGVNVISEKPMSISYDDALAAVNLAEEKGLQYGVIFQCRYNPSSRLVKERISDGSLGRVKGAGSVLAWCRTDDYYTSSDWKGTWEKEGGGVIINQAIHTMDLVNWLIDDTHCSLQATLTNREHKSIEVEDSAEGIIHYKNGAVYTFYATNNFLTNEPIEIRITCENGSAILSSDEAIIRYNDGRIERLEKDAQSCAQYSGGKTYWGTQHGAQIHQFYQAVLKNEPLEISGREALKIQKLVCDIYSCGRNL